MICSVTIVVPPSLCQNNIVIDKICVQSDTPTSKVRVKYYVRKVLGAISFCCTRSKNGIVVLTKIFVTQVAGLCKLYSYLLQIFIMTAFLGCAVAT